MLANGGKTSMLAGEGGESTPPVHSIPHSNRVNLWYKEGIYQPMRYNSGCHRYADFASDNSTLGERKTQNSKNTLQIHLPMLWSD